MGPGVLAWGADLSPSDFNGEEREAGRVWIARIVGAVLSGFDPSR